MANSYENARKAIYQRFLAEWNTGTYQACFANSPAPKTTQAWVRLAIRWGNSRRLDIGSSAPFEEQTGVILVQAFLPPNEGEQGAHQIADEVRRIFAHQTFATDSGGKIRTFAPRMVAVGKVTTTGAENNWQQHNVQVPFRLDEIV